VPTLRKFAAVHASIHNHLNQERHLYTRKNFRLNRSAALVTVTARIPDDGLYYDLMADESTLTAAGIKSVTRVGDCLAPGTIAAAVHSGHAHARAIDEPDPGDVPFKRERVVA